MRPMRFAELRDQLRAMPDAVKWNMEAVEFSFRNGAISRAERDALLQVHETAVPSSSSADIQTSLAKVRSFDFAEMSKQPVPIVFFSESSRVALQTICLNLLRVLNSPIAPLTDDDLKTIHALLQKKFNCKAFSTPFENIMVFVAWIKQNFLFMDRSAVLRAITDHTRTKYGEAISSEIVSLHAHADIEDLEKTIDRRVESWRGALTNVSKQDIFELFFLRYAVLRISQNGPERLASAAWDEEYETFKTGFNRRKDRIFRFGPSKKIVTWNYEAICEAADIVLGANNALYERYKGYDVLFLARDGLIFFEAYAACYPSLRPRLHNIYVSRDTLNVDRCSAEYEVSPPAGDFFNRLRDAFLAPSLRAFGATHINLVIDDIKTRMRVALAGNGDDALFFQHFSSELYSYLGRHMETQRVVFFDSSSKTLPVLLAAFCRLMYPEREFKAFFAITSFSDPTAGYLVGKTDNYATDFLSAAVVFNKSASQVLPYDPRIKDASLMKQAQHFLALLVLYSRMKD